MPLLSIVIATKNRIPYVINAMNTILSLPETEVELVIQDNSDSRELADYVQAKVTDSRLIYNYTPPPFSSMDNFNKAVSLATGEYLCLIGDDDGINPEIITAVRWAQKNDIEALTPSVNVQYLWPCVTHKSLVRNMQGGNLSIHAFSGHMTYVNVEKELEALARNGGQRYLELNLPKLYHGIVKRSCIEEIKTTTGYYLGGLSPDIYAAIALAHVSKKTVTVDYPLTIPGACNASTSIDAIKGKHSGRRLEDAIHFRDRGAYPWHNRVPRLYSVETIWAETALVALEDFKRDDLLLKFNLPMLYAYCLFANPQCGDIILKNLNRNLHSTQANVSIGFIRFIIALVTGPGWKLFRQAKQKLMRNMSRNSRTTITGVNNISEATQRLSDYLGRNGFHFGHST